MPQLYYKDISSEKISSLHKKWRQTEQGSATRTDQTEKPSKQVSLSPLLKGMTTSTQRQAPVFVKRPSICLTPRVRPRRRPHLGQFTDTKARAAGSAWCRNWYARSQALYFEATNHVLLCRGMCHFKGFPWKPAAAMSDDLWQVALKDSNTIWAGY